MSTVSPRNVAWRTWLLMWRAKLWAERNFLVLLWIAFIVTVIAYYVIQTAR